MNLFDANKIEKIIITPEMISAAEARDPHEAYNNKSFMDGEGNFIGLLGEEMVKWWRPDLIPESTFDYDFICNHKHGKFTVDVKTKYTTSTRINLSYIGTWMASVCKDSVHQKVDWYVFCRICKVDNGNEFEYPFGWVAGSISKKEFFDKARFYPKGTPEGDNGYTVKQDCYSIPYSQLYQVNRKANNV